jgi:hypothetical protein
VQQLRGGPAYLFTYVRSTAETVHSLALIELGATNYTIDKVAKADDTAAAEATAIVRAFGP